MCPELLINDPNRASETSTPNLKSLHYRVVLKIFGRPNGASKSTFIFVKRQRNISCIPIYFTVTCIKIYFAKEPCTNRFIALDLQAENFKYQAFGAPEAGSDWPYSP